MVSKLFDGTFGDPPNTRGVKEKKHKRGIRIKASHKGLLHKELGIKEDMTLTTAELEKAKHSSDPKERKRANFALNARKWKH